MTAFVLVLAQVFRGLAIAEGNTSSGKDGIGTLLQRVRRWGCQYQNLDVAEIEGSDLQLIVVDHALGEPGSVIASAASVEQLKHTPNGDRRVVLAYLSVGEAETYRTYWHEQWRSSPPDWLGKANPDWPGAIGVRFWDAAWKELVYRGNDSILDHILAAGFDGVFLDRVDAYVDWTTERPAAGLEMIELLGELRNKAMQKRPGFLIISQNAEDLLKLAEYRRLIDGVAKESLLYGLSGLGIANASTDIAWSLSRLQLAREAGLPVFAIEYLDDPDKIARARSEFAKAGIVPFFANRELNRLPIP